MEKADYPPPHQLDSQAQHQPNSGQPPAYAHPHTGAAQQHGGYAAPPQQGGYAAPPQQGGYASPAQQGGYMQPAPGGAYYGPQGGQPQVNTVTVVTGPPRFGENPLTTTCTTCHNMITTTTESRIGMYAWMWVGIIVLIGFFLFPAALCGCCFIPLCVESCKDVEHRCPSCSTVLGTYKRGC